MNLFEYEESQQDEADFYYYKCMLSVPIGRHAAGTRIPAICVDYDDMSIVFFDAGGNPVEAYSFELKLGNQL